MRTTFTNDYIRVISNEIISFMYLQFQPLLMATGLIGLLGDHVTKMVLQ